MKYEIMSFGVSPVNYSDSDLDMEIRSVFENYHPLFLRGGLLKFAGFRTAIPVFIITGLTRPYRIAYIPAICQSI